jgi:nitrogen regulatory protein P-II 1
MKKIEAIVKPFKLEAIKEALEELGIRGMTVTEVNGFGQPQQGRAETVRGRGYPVDYLPRLKLEIVVCRRIANRAVKAVVKASKSAKNEDNKIFVSNIDRAIRIRTGEHGDSAL